MFTSSINQRILESIFEDFEIELYLKREDLIHPYVSGNKFRKLKYNIQEALAQNHDTLLTFGGAYSNHIQAVAYAGKKHGFKTIGIIRGEELALDLKKTLSQNRTLAFAKTQGMELHFISRKNYRLKEESSFQDNLKQQFGDFYLLPEGGTNPLAIKGCEEILNKNDNPFNYICCAVGTGGTVSGLINSIQIHQKVIGFSVLKEDYLHYEIEKNTNNLYWKLNRSYHFNGYAKINTELITFINQFYKKHQISLDPIYTGKLIFGIYKEIVKGNFPKKSRILAIHTGGLQGIAGINTKLKKQGLPIIKTDYEF